MRKPAVFIGSSSEGLEIAKAISWHLQSSSEPTVWDEGVFQPNMSNLEALVNSLNKFDFAVLIFTPDDKTTYRGIEKLSPRDNVLFELGMFIGRLGRQRTYIVTERSVDVPSDLHGISLMKYDADRSDGNLTASLSGVGYQIRTQIQSIGLRRKMILEKINTSSEHLQNRVDEAIERANSLRDYIQEYLKLAKDHGED